MTLRRVAGINAGDPTRPGLLELPHPPPWTERALCAQVDPELFFPPKGGATRAAKRVCTRCPVIAECLEWALSFEAVAMYGTNIAQYGGEGIYGGLSPRQRRRLLRDRQAAS